MSWKPISIKYNLLKNVLQKKNKKHFIVYNKSIRISPLLLTRKFKLHNGKSLFNLRVKPEHVGKRFGEFCFTRKNFDKGLNSKYKKLRKRKTTKKPLKLKINSKTSLKTQIRGNKKNLLSEKRYKLRTLKTIRIF